MAGTIFHWEGKISCHFLWGLYRHFATNLLNSKYMEKHKGCQGSNPGEVSRENQYWMMNDLQPWKPMKERFVQRANRQWSSLLVWIIIIGVECDFQCARALQKFMTKLLKFTEWSAQLESEVLRKDFQGVYFMNSVKPSFCWWSRSIASETPHVWMK